MQYLETLQRYDIETLHIIIAAVSFIVGLVFGALIFGRRHRRLANELEEELLISRSRDKGVVLERDMSNALYELDEEQISKLEEAQLVAEGSSVKSVEVPKRNEPLDTGKELAGYHEEGRVQSKKWPAQNHKPSAERAEVIKDISSEIKKIKSILEVSSIDVDALKEYLDSADISVKSASNQLEDVLSKLDEKYQEQASQENTSDDA